MKVLYIGYDFSDNKVGGNIGRENHYKVLKELYKENLYEVIIGLRKNTRDILSDYLTLSFNGQTKEIEQKIFKIIEDKKIDKIVFDGSTFGNLARKIKKQYSNKEIITFFHNIERNYFKERIKVEGITRSILLPSIIHNENLCVKYSDKLILLNKRDINELEKIYNDKLENKKIYEIPIYLEDRYDPTIELKKCDYDYLFIGSGFYANIHGISWFIENVLPNIEGKLLVIGKGMEVLREKYKDSEKLEIKGTVENIDEYYYEDNIIVSPIFYGSGMKTKTIEALMFNKTIIGTSEAFIGINTDRLNQNDYCICNIKESFIENINKMKKIKNNNKNRKLYEENYSSRANIKLLKEIME
ncbi:glycosyltransferase family 4 protein [Fusobacterium mortiferum]|uniref:glycosyltransferase family 4 protein n=1 Tax=Fusobacterium mortiferum TaxID=850 RepID=UPI0035652AAA